METFNVYFCLDLELVFPFKNFALQFFSTINYNSCSQSHLVLHSIVDDQFTDILEGKTILCLTLTLWKPFHSVYVHWK